MRALRRPGRGRNIVGIALAVTMLSLMVPTPAAAVITGFGGALLTDDTFPQGNPEPWGGVVVWDDMRNGNYDIYASAGSEFAVCMAAGHQYEPALSDDYIVWTDDRNGFANGDIYAYEMATHIVFAICAAAGRQAQPDIYERYVVWEDQRSGNWDIYAYDLVTHTEFPVCTAAGDQRRPLVWGDQFAWRDFRTNVGGDIWGWDASVGGQPMPIVMTGNSYGDYDLCQEWIVWSGNSSGTYDVYAYNLSTERARAVYTGAGTQSAPRLDGDWLVFENQQPGNPDIEFYDMLANQYYDYWADLVDTNYSPSMRMGAIANLQRVGTDFEVAIGGPTWTHDTQSIWGSDRYQTAAAIALAAFPNGSPSVMIATGENFPDALGAAALAGEKNIPLLLTDGDELSAQCANAIDELGIDEDVWIIGGESAISDHVVMQINNAIAADIDPPRRVAGPNRYATALAIANVISGGTGGLDEPYGFVATGLNYPDALAASSIAYALDIPIYLVPGTSIPAATMDQMQVDGVTKPIILGGTGAVGPAVETSLKARFGTNNVNRVWGPNRYQTAYEISQFAKDSLDFGMSGACIATGESFPDALAGGQLAGVRYAPMILTDGDALSLAAQDFCTGNENEVRYITILGGPGAISQGVRNSIGGFLK